jgi:hypothetical protein
MPLGAKGYRTAEATMEDGDMSVTELLRCNHRGAYVLAGSSH